MNKKILANTEGIVTHASSFSLNKSNNHNRGPFAATNSSSLLADIQLSTKTFNLIHVTVEFIAHRQDHQTTEAVIVPFI